MSIKMSIKICLSRDVYQDLSIKICLSRCLSTRGGRTLHFQSAGLLYNMHRVHVKGVMIEKAECKYRLYIHFPNWLLRLNELVACGFSMKLTSARGDVTDSEGPPTPPSYDDKAL